MFRELQQVLRLLMTAVKTRQRRAASTAGGLLVLLWTEEGGFNCTVAAAGPWCTGITVTELQTAFADLREILFPCTFPCPDPDLNELWAFTALHGSLRVLLSFQVKDVSGLSSEWQVDLETLFGMFSLANARVEIRLLLKRNKQMRQSQFRVKNKRKISLEGGLSPVLDVTCNMQPPEFVKRGRWCQGGHPVLGDTVSLSIPPRAMDRGLYGELSIQPVTVFRPCVTQYPNVATQLTRIQVLVYSPSNVPVAGPSAFLQNLPAHLDYKDLGLHSLHCSSFKDLMLSGGTAYAVQRGTGAEDSTLPTVHQSLLLFLFLQHSDPFTSDISEMIATEALMERHLEEILSNNHQAVTAALQTELKNALKAQRHRERIQEKLCSAVDVILSSSISILTSSSNMDFRNTCMERMKVRDTGELSATFRESLRRVTSWKFAPRSRCYSARMEENPQSDERTRAEI